MTEKELQALLEDALHAQVAARCIRAYKHDVRNSLQGIYGGIDALIRFAQPGNSSAITPDRTVELVREAIARHERSLDRMIENLARVEDEPADFDAAALLAELTSFLRNDAAHASVKLRVTLAEHAIIRAQLRRMRLALLALLTDSIDAMPGGGELLPSVRSDANGVVIEVTDTRRTDTEPDRDPWTLDLQRQPLRRGIALHVVRALVEGQAGRIECETGRDGGRVVRMTFRAAFS